MKETEKMKVGESLPLDTVLDSLPYNADGLLPAIAQQHDTGEVLMLAWMNSDAVRETLATGRVCYWSRSRRQLWRKGETSGAVQQLLRIDADCDRDARPRGHVPEATRPSGDEPQETTPSAQTMRLAPRSKRLRRAE